MPLPILTERLALRPYDPDDVAQIHTVLYGDPEAMRLLGGPLDVHGARAAVERYIAQLRREGYSFAPVIERETGLIAGEAGLYPFAGGGPDVELGYALGPAFWGRGYATEAGRALLAEAFGPLGVDRVVAVTREENTGSRHVLAKLGFIPAGRRHAWGFEQLYFVRERRRDDAPAATI